MLNEHHNAPFCMQAKCNVFASILAAVTKKAKIVLLGNPLPLGREPGAPRRRAGDDRHDLEGPPRLRLCPRRRPGAARHRRQPGLQPRALRGGARPRHRRLDAAQGPFRWEGTHYQHRVVNPWAVPLQKPYPRVWIPGVLQPGDDHLGGEAALSRISRSTPRSRRPRASGRSTTRPRARSATSPGRRTAATCSRSTSPTARKRPRRTPASSCGCRASSPASRIRCGRTRRAISRPTLRRNFVEFAVGRAENPRGRPTFEQQVADGRVFFGTPKTVIPKIRRVLEETRPVDLRHLGQ